MPTYEYHCSSCNSTYELRQGFDAATEHLCEECKKATAKRVLHAPRVLFKGSGFYVTDSKGKSTAGATDAPAASSDAKGDSKSDSGESKAPAKTEAATTSSNSESSSSSASASAASSD